MRGLISILIILYSFPGISQDAKNVLLLDHWMDTNLTLGVEDARLSDVWGFDQNGGLYCAVGTTEGVSFFQIDQGQLNLVDEMAGAFQGYTVVHRDMKTYRNYLYAVGDEGTATLQIFDLSYLPDSVSKVYDSNALFTVCHNIYIDTLNAKLYACGSNNNGMKVIDISNPENPTLIYNYTQVPYVHDCYVRNDTAFLNCGYDGLKIYDFSGAIPIELGLLDFYADQGYNHSGWMSPNGKLYAFCDETLGAKIKLCQLNEYSMIKVDQTFGTDDYLNYTPHNIYLTNELAFVAYYNEGLRVFDLARSPIKEVGKYDTFHQETEYTLNGAWGIYVFEKEELILVSDRQNGLYLLSFPIALYEASNSQISVYNTPFVDGQSILLPKDLFLEDDLTFTISDIDGKVIYKQASYVNWVNLPQTLSAGSYVYGIYDKDGKLIDSGKFVKAN
ncbi:MAG: choice-of-anchor B family protein [Crocinitomicaceae bacterium]